MPVYTRSHESSAASMPEKKCTGIDSMIFSQEKL
jgi:hypothetical protein